ncbi:LacI family transcriptional regulator [Nostoc sp. 3335mG]|nr:LacI family transcriptional regulator [Nostoc sp. 3335mG]
MPTIKDVARHAGVAISTASAAINRSAPVSEEIIAKVEAAVRAIGYVPHGAAQSLRSGQSRLIGLLVPNVANPHFSAMARVIENVCLSAGYLSVVYSSGQDEDRENQILRMMRQQRVAGLIIVPTQSHAEHGRYLAKEIHVPTVLLDMPVEGLTYNAVKLDNVRATRMATDYLLDLGHTNIVALGGLPGLLTSTDRVRGYREGLEARGLSFREDNILPGGYEFQQAFESVTAVMRGKAPPTGIISFSNLMTMGALQALRDLSIPVPNDVSLVGVDDLDFADLLSPAPTVVRAPIAEMARRSILLLLDEVEKRSGPSGKLEVFPPELVIRGSAAPPRIAAGSSPDQ